MGQREIPAYKIAMEIDPDSKPGRRKNYTGLESVYWMVTIRNAEGQLIQTTSRRQTYEQAIHVLNASRYAFSAGMAEARSLMYGLVTRSTIDDVTPGEDILMIGVSEFLRKGEQK